MSQNLPPAGWYPDPHDQNQNRYFDGAQWTDNYLPKAAGPAPESWHVQRPDAPGTSTGQIGFTSIGNLLGDSWTAMIKRIGPLVALALAPLVVYFGGFVVIVLIGLATIFDAGFNPSSLGSSVAALIAAVLIFMILLVVVVAATQLITARILLGQHRGIRLGIGDAWRQVKGRMLSYIGVLIAIGVAFVFAYVIFAVVAITSGFEPLLVAVSFLLLGPLLIFVFVKLAFISVAAAADRSAGIVSASSIVSQGRFWSVLGRLIVIVLAPVVVLLLLQLLSFGLRSNALSAIVLLVGLVVNLLAGIFYAAGASKIYLESGGSTDLALSR